MPQLDVLKSSTLAVSFLIFFWIGYFLFLKYMFPFWTLLVKFPMKIQLFYSKILNLFITEPVASNSLWLDSLKVLYSMDLFTYFFQTYFLIDLKPFDLLLEKDCVTCSLVIAV